MDHQTIIRNIDGTLTSINCPCGEDHGPSLHEELEIMRASNRKAAANLTRFAQELDRVLELTTVEATQQSGANRLKARQIVNTTSIALGRVARDLTVLS